MCTSLSLFIINFWSNGNKCCVSKSTDAKSALFLSIIVYVSILLFFIKRIVDINSEYVFTLHKLFNFFDILKLRNSLLFVLK